MEEQRVSGGVDLNYFHEPIGSIYQGLGNIMLRLEPTDQPAAANATLLLNAHYDSTLGSQGELLPAPPPPPQALDPAQGIRLDGWQDPANLFFS